MTCEGLSLMDENKFQQLKDAVKDEWSSYKGLTVDTLAHRGDEGRGYLR